MNPSAEHMKTAALPAGLALSLILYALIYIWQPGLAQSSIKANLILTFHAVPAFCLQWMLCRMDKPAWVRWLPLALLVAVAVTGALDLSGTLGSGWDVLGGAILLCWCIAPAAGLALGWMANGQKLAAIGVFVMLAVYVYVKSLGGPLWHLEPMDLAALAVLAAGLYFLFRK